MNAEQAYNQSAKNSESILLKKINEEYEACQNKIKLNISLGEMTATCRRLSYPDALIIKKPFFNQTIYDYTMNPQTVRKFQDQGFQVTTEFATSTRYFDENDYHGWKQPEKFNKISWQPSDN